MITYSAKGKGYKKSEGGVRTQLSIMNYKNENRLGITATANCKKKKQWRKSGEAA